LFCALSFSITAIFSYDNYRLEGVLIFGVFYKSQERVGLFLSGVCVVGIN
jgi:hypothetical protein